MNTLHDNILNHWSGHTKYCLTQNLLLKISAMALRANKKPFYLGLTGDGALGKTTISQYLVDLLPNSILLCTDSFVLSRVERRKLDVEAGDDPRAIDICSIVNVLQKVSQGKDIVEIPYYNHSNGKKVSGKLAINDDLRFVVVDGTASVYAPIRQHLDYLLFLSSADMIRYELRRKVDTGERGYSHHEFELLWPKHLSTYNRFVKPLAMYCDDICQVTSNWTYTGNFIVECYC